MSLGLYLSTFLLIRREIYKPMLDSNILEQVKGVFASLSSDITLSVTRNSNDENSAEFSSFLEDFASTSDKIKTVYKEGEQFSFSILRNGEETGISFRGIPNGHEFTSLLLAVLNTDGQGKNLPDEAIAARIKSLKGEIRLQTYVSLTCTNCPDVVQALNVMALINPNISNEMVDGGLCQDEIQRLNIQGVPSVYVNGEPLHTGRGDLGILLQELEDKVGTDHDENAVQTVREYDVIVLGGGPAGASSAIYSARKGLRVAIVAERIGGQVNDTTGIENLISVTKTTGTQLAADLRTHINDCSIDVFDNRKVVSTNLKEAVKTVSVRGGETFTAPAVVIATGASWRRLGLPDEEKYIGHGEHFCPHCDGPFYKGKDVAVIGGGNSGIEAAIDLAGICRHVTVLEFADAMRADEVLQQKVASLPNVEVFLSTQTTALLGDGQKLSGIRVKDRINDEEREIALDGVFVQIGLSPNSDAFKDQVEVTPRNEIIVDATNRTSLSGVYAAGDVTTVPYKQITIAMGEGAKAALSAFDDRIRGVIIG